MCQSSKVSTVEVITHTTLHYTQGDLEDCLNEVMFVSDYKVLNRILLTIHTNSGLFKVTYDKRRITDGPLKFVANFPTLYLPNMETELFVMSLVLALSYIPACELTSHGNCIRRVDIL